MEQPTASAEQNMETDQRRSLLANVLKHMRDPELPGEAFAHWFEHARFVARNFESDDTLNAIELEIGEELQRARLLPLAR